MPIPNQDGMNVDFGNRKYGQAVVLVDSIGDPAALETGPVTTTPTDRSGSITTGGSSQVLAPANSVRKFFMVQNLSDVDMWISFTGPASIGGGSYLVAANGGAYETSTWVPLTQITIFCSTTGKTFSALEA